MKLDKKHLLIPGSKVIDRDKEDNICFLPVFKHGDADTAWLFGTHIMKDYYWLFDATDATHGWRLGFGRRANDLTLDPLADNVIPPNPDDDEKGMGPTFWTILAAVSAMLLCGAVLLFRRFCFRKRRYNSE